MYVYIYIMKSERTLLGEWRTIHYPISPSLWWDGTTFHQLSS